MTIHPRTIVFYKIVEESMFRGALVKYRCPACNSRLKSSICDAGKDDTCPDCGACFIVPGQRSDVVSEKSIQEPTAQDQVSRHKHATSEAGNREDGNTQQARNLGAKQMSNNARDSKWYYKIMGETVGPLSFEELKTHSQDSRLTPEMYIRRQGTETWISTMEIEELFSRLENFSDACSHVNTGGMHFKQSRFLDPPGRNSNTTHPTSALLNPFSLAVAIIALLILPLFIWQYITISCQLAEYEVSKRQAYDSGGLAFSSGVARSIAPNENRQAWIDGFDAAAKVDSALKFQAEIAEQDHRKTIEAKTLEDAERIADLQRKAKIFVACDEHLEATYRKSGKYSTRLQDLYAINQAVENAETAWETSMQRKLLEGLYTAIELDEYEQVKNILLQYGLHSFDDWRALTTLASSNGW